MGGKKRLELALGVQRGGGQQPRIDAHCDLVHDACRVGDAVGGLEDRTGSSWGSQEVGHRCSCDQRASWGIGQ